MKKAITALIALCLALVFASCTPSVGKPATVNSGHSSAEAAGSTSSNLETPDQARIEYLESLGIDDAPVDLNDLEAVTKVYVSPIPAGGAWFYSWKTPSEIEADDLIFMFSYNNFLNWPRDFEFSYEEGYRDAPADQVEAILQKHFDVESDHLKKSQFYNAENRTYSMVTGGGGCWMTAMSAEQNGNQIVIKVGIISMMSEADLMPGESLPEGIRGSDGFTLTPTGTLTVELGNENIVKYISYQLNDGFEW
ncbi:hypothetical protein V6615_12750 [Oscillospiraceae bacterium PP1C4]